MDNRDTKSGQNVQQRNDHVEQHDGDHDDYQQHVDDLFEDWLKRYEPQELAQRPEYEAGD